MITFRSSPGLPTRCHGLLWGGTCQIELDACLIFCDISHRLSFQALKLNARSGLFSRCYSSQPVVLATDGDVSMKFKFALTLLIGIAPALTAENASGQESSWKLPRLNPFKRDSGTTKAPTNLSKGLRLPRLPQSFSKPVSANRLIEGPRNILAKTKDLMTPWKKNSPSRSRLRSAAGVRAARKKSNRWNPLAWFRRPETKPPPVTAHDFIARQAPGF